MTERRAPERVAPDVTDAVYRPPCRCVRQALPSDVARRMRLEPVVRYTEYCTDVPPRDLERAFAVGRE